MASKSSERTASTRQYKRPRGGFWAWTERIYIPCPLRIKNEFSRIARENRMSQAELGTVLVTLAIESPWMIEGAIIVHRRKDSGKWPGLEENPTS